VWWCPEPCWPRCPVLHPRSCSESGPVRHPWWRQPLVIPFHAAPVSLVKVICLLNQITLPFILYGLELGLHCAALPSWQRHPRSWGFPPVVPESCLVVACCCEPICPRTALWFWSGWIVRRMWILRRRKLPSIIEGLPWGPSGFVIDQAKRRDAAWWARRRVWRTSSFQESSLPGTSQLGNHPVAGPTHDEPCCGVGHVGWHPVDVCASYLYCGHPCWKSG
jgi:hypothetical protein